MKKIYEIPAPDSPYEIIEIYGEPDMGWYEWRIIDGGGRITRDTSSERGGGRQYGQAEIALRDALMFATGMQIDNDVERDKSVKQAVRVVDRGR